jgi:polyisoprenoid-binding protein YceI
VDPRSIETDFPDPKYNFNAELAGPQWLDAAQFPEIAFRTTRVEDLGNQAMRVHADLTMRGVTRPIVLDATYNGGYVGHPMDPHARVGFSAHGVLRRSEFGIAGGIPQAGANMGVGDRVAVTIESEFNGPPLSSAEGAGAQAAKTQ